MDTQEIGIVDTRTIIKTVMDQYGYDFSDYALTSFKRRLERFIQISGVKYMELFISKLSADKEFFNKFLDEMLVPSTELFRDPSLWRWLRDEHFNQLEKDDIKILIPECVSGDELYTMSILLSEIDLYKTAKVYATSISERLIKNIKDNPIPLKKIEVSIENYKRFQGDYELTKYFNQVETDFYREISLLENIEFSVVNIKKEELPKRMDVILFRNHLVYYNPSLQASMIDKLSDSLKVGGILLLGSKENIANLENTKLALLNEAENVFRKKDV